MKKAEVEIGGRYMAKVSGKRVTVRITAVSIYGGWDAVSETSGRQIRVRGAQRLHPLVAVRCLKCDNCKAVAAAKLEYKERLRSSLELPHIDSDQYNTDNDILAEWKAFRDAHACLTPVSVAA
jgi:hypothetical protein